MTYTVMPIKMPSYEKRLDTNRTWALREGGMFFQNESEVQKSLSRITGRLHDLSIDYAVVGGMALFLHGYRRFTEGVDLLVTPDGLVKVHAALEGSGYRPPFPNSKNLRDTENGVRIEFLVTGEYPGDGKPKPVAFPDPSTAATPKDNMALLNLTRLIELKLASGLTSTDRLKDLADVQELIKILALPKAYATQLDASVREQYSALWQGVETARLNRQGGEELG